LETGGKLTAVISVHIPGSLRICDFGNCSRGRWAAPTRAVTLLSF